jgi:hypothetical protein
VRDGVHQVGLAEAGRTVDEERIIIVSGLLRDGERGAVGHLVLRTHDEMIEGVGRLDRRSRRGGRGGARGARRGRRRRGGLAGGVDRSGQAVIHVAAGDQRELTTQHFAVVAVDPGFREDGRSLEHEHLALLDAERLQGRDPGLEVGARKRVTKLGLGGLPKGKVAGGSGHQKGEG